MSYCINPHCQHRQNSDNSQKCLSCGTELLINQRIRLIEPLIPLESRNYTEVFEVDDLGTRKVMKVLKSQDSKLIELFKREALVLQLLEHSGIPAVTMDDYFTFTKHESSLELHCLVMQKFEGQNLEEWVKAHGRVSQALALNLFQQLLEILDLVHCSGFFHRDIKPSNIILQTNNHLALIDFGAVREVTNTYLAKISSSEGTDIGIGGQYEITVIRTPCYSPLEQINGQAVPQSDFYAVGRTLVYLVTEIALTKLPTDPQTGKLIWRKHAPQIDKPFADFIDELMATFPGQRPPSTRVILQRLEKLPLQSKIHRLIKSKLFIISAAVASITIINCATIKIVLPELANYLIAQGKKSEAASNTEEAQQFFNSAIKINLQVKFSISQFYFDKASRNLNNPQIAKKYYELAIQYNELDASAYNNLAVMCQQLQDDKCVEESYNKLLQLKLNSWEGNYGLGYFYDTRGKYDLARKQYELAIKISDQAIHAVAALARLNNKNGDYNVAVALALKGLEKTSNPELQASLYKDLGWASLMQNKLGKAKRYLEKATELDAQRTDAYCLLAQVEEANGEIENARISIEACMLAKSSLPEVFEWRQKLLNRILEK
ncbi:protein kinase domain-containing protein [Nostoc sp. PA-18-2419]|uniref:protein kinase domain-containing protein n=1 Tax=Nostoc sp. PA-18-2419 TaxID=2575443 RepID=UPI001CB8FAD0|nr:4-Cys prefix domain-containing protein [Nostoc sp. PA-18-2419]